MRLIPDFSSCTKCILPCESVGSSCARQITCNQPLWWWRRNQFVVLAPRSRWVSCTVVPNAIGFWVYMHPIQSSSSSWSPSWNVWQIQNSSAMESTTNKNKAQWQVARTLQRWSVGVLYHFYIEKKTGGVEGQEKNALHSYILEKLKDDCDLKIGRNSNNRGKDEVTHTSPRAIELAEAVIPPHINTLDPINEAEWPDLASCTNSFAAASSATKGEFSQR